MPIESATTINQLDAANPGSNDLKSEGDNHIRLLKSTIKATFPNITGAVTATHTELNTIANKASKTGDTYIGAQDFTGATTTVATQVATDNTTKAASTAMVQSAILASSGITAQLPAQSGNSGKFLTTNGSTASWGDAGSLVRSARTSNTVLGTADKSTLIDITSGTFTQTFDAAATLGNGWFCYIRNSGTGTVTLDPNGSETIDGVVSGVITPGMALLIQCDGAAFHCVRIGPQIAMQVLTSGTTWTCPLGVRTAKITGTGGGGSGGKSSGSVVSAGGSGAGTFIKQVRLTPGTAYTYAIGSAGASQTTAGVAGNNGGNTTFNDGVTTYTATGGGGGSAGTQMTNSFTAGSTATNGDINVRGGWGLGLASSESTACGDSFLGANIGRPSATGDGYGSGGAGATSSLNSGAGAPGAIVLEY